MSNKQDCTQTLNMLAAVFSHDIGGVIGMLSGYPQIFQHETDVQVSNYDEILDYMVGARATQKNVQTTFSSVVDYVKSNAGDCMDDVNNLINAANQMYAYDILEWYNLLEQLHTHYLESHVVDQAIIQKMASHASNMNDFRTWVLDTYRPL